MSRIWHIITPEYPPATGGVSDYTRQIALGLRDAGDEAHVWRPDCEDRQSLQPSWVHPLPGMTRRGLRWLGEQLDRFPGPRRLLVQWVPHGYGYRSMNLPFCGWLWGRARRGDIVDIMAHEAFLGFGEGSLRQDAAAVVHRLMTVILLRAASRVQVSTPAWELRWRPYALGKQIPFTWLPIPSNIPVTVRPQETARLRRRYAREGQAIVGHFGTHSFPVTRMLDRVLPSLLLQRPDRVLLLIGSGSDEYRDLLIHRYPILALRVTATGTLDPDEISCHLAACNLLLQPFPDGITTRRCSAMAALAHGIPMVTTTGHLTESFWRDSRAVALAPAGDYEAFTKITGELLDDAETLVRLGKAAQSFYAERFDIRHVISMLRGEPGEVELCCESH